MQSFRPWNSVWSPEQRLRVIPTTHLGATPQPLGSEEKLWPFADLQCQYKLGSEQHTSPKGWENTSLSLLFCLILLEQEPSITPFGAESELSVCSHDRQANSHL